MDTIDLSYLEDITGGDKEIMVEMITLLLEETPTHLQTIASSFAHKNWQQLASASHKIKPMLLYVGLTDLSDITKELEAIGKSEEGIEKLPGLISRLQTGFKAVIGDLQEKVRELS
jgi:HPt (histidine-containing phosphotransfer) domain-containing protein